MGPRSVLLLEGAEHLVAPQGDAAPVPRRADARLRAGDRRGRSTPRSTRGRSRREFPIHPRMQAVTLEVIMRAVFGVSEPAAPSDALRALGRMLAGLADPGVQLGCCSRGASAASDPLERLRRDARRGRRAALRGDRRAAGRPGARRARRHPRDAGRGAVRGRRRARRRRASRPARHPAARRPRDHRDRARLDLRPAAAKSRAAGAAARRARRGRRRVPACGDLRVAAAAPGGAARGAPAGRRAAGRRVAAAGGHRRHPGVLAHPHPTRPLPASRSSSAPSASWRARRRPTRGCRSAAAFAAASARPSPSSRCGSCCARCSPAASCAAPARRPSGSRAATSPSRPETARR